jgi:hypothetical protein
VPKGLGLRGAGYPVRETLPRVFSKRQQNRGFEGLGVSGGRLYIALQSPLALPDMDAAKKPRVTRILAVDLRTGKAVGEYGLIAGPVRRDQGGR